MTPETRDSSEAWIDALLRDDAHAYIADDGFTRRVTAALPRRRAWRALRTRQFWPLFMTALASLVVLFALPGSSRMVADAVSDFGSLQLASPSTLALVVIGAMFCWLGIAGALEEK